MKYLYRGQLFESVENTIVAYHGSPYKFDRFKPTLNAYWFTDKPEYAASEGEYVYSVRLTMNNPYRWVQGDSEPDDPEFISKLKADGYDSCIAPSNVGMIDYVVYSVTQIQIIDVKKKTLLESENFPESINVAGKTRPTRNSRGGKIYSTIEGITNFWNWFGDSKTVDSSGRPIVYFHGTARTGIGEFTGDRGYAGHFTEKPEFAEDFANSRYADAVDNGTDIEYGDAATIYPVYLKCMNIFNFYDQSQRHKIGVYDDQEQYGYDDVENFRNEIVKAGFDSAYDYEHSDGEITGIAVVNANQIKSATGNAGTFSNEGHITKE